MNGLRANGTALAEDPDRAPTTARTLHDLRRVFEAEEAREHPDVTLPLAKLRLTGEDLLRIPGRGDVVFNDWSRRQCASLVGLRWDRWFENATPSERAEELNRRFQRAQGQVRLRTMDLADSERSDHPGADGLLRAFVSPGYTPVRDSEVATALATALTPVDPELRIIRFDQTDRTASYVVAVGKPYQIGGPGDVGDVWGGLLVRNSGVGFASLLLSLHLTRLVCKNGMTAPLPDALLLRRRHRGLAGGKLAGLLAERMFELPGQLHVGAEALRAAAGRAITNAEHAVRSFLDRFDLPARHLRPILDAFAHEPHLSAFGISQAVTLAAQQVSPEERLDLETAAGMYLQQTN
jgi:hypothetical protein